MKNNIIIEIYGTGTHNRGAELMAVAIWQRISNKFPNIKFAVEPKSWPYQSRAKYGFHVTGDLPGRKHKRFLKSLYLILMPKVLCKIFGLVRQKDIDIVIDASGFAFSDQWGHGQARRLYRKMNKKESKHQLLILMPQALGPFNKKEVRYYSRKIFERADIVCARDDISFRESEKLTAGENLKRYPDFTIGVEPLDIESISLPANFLAIVPNVRMLDKTENASAYITFLKTALDESASRGMNPVFVLHDSEEDKKIIDLIDKEGHYPVYTDEDPRVLKAILGRAKFVIASRFHALVSALSQGVICIGAGWSHKYPELFRDFDNSDFLVSDISDCSLLIQLLDRIEDTERLSIDKQRLLTAAQLLKKDVEKMWNDIESLVLAKIEKVNVH